MVTVCVTKIKTNRGCVRSLFRDMLKVAAFDFEKELLMDKDLVEESLKHLAK